jgi:hypothetical protein
MNPAHKHALEQALITNVHDTQAWVVYADFLSSIGDVLGQRIALGLAFEWASGKLAKQLAHQCREYDRMHQHEWIGPSLTKLMRSRGFDLGAELEWRHGFMTAATLKGRQAKRRASLATMLATVLASSASRFLQALTLMRGESGDPQEMASAFRVLATADLPQTLTVLRLDATRWRKKSTPSEPIDLAQLSVLGARLPRVRTLELSLPSQGDELVRVLAEAPWIERLEGLAITASSMTDVGAEYMLAARGRFSALGHIDLNANHLSPHVVDELVHFLPGMSHADRWDDPSLYWIDERDGAWLPDPSEDSY